MAKTSGINVGLDELLLSGDATKLLRGDGTEATPATILGFTPMNATGANAALPTADPHVAGKLWANSGIVTVSAG